MNSKQIITIEKHIRSSNSKVHSKLLESLHIFNRHLKAKNFAAIEKKYGPESVDIIMDYFISKEDYETCMLIRDRHNQTKQCIQNAK